MSDYISREEAVEKLAQYMISVTKQFNMTALPYAVYESRARSVLKDIPGRQIEQVASKLKNHCDSLLKSDAAECKEHESKLDLVSRADAIEALGKLLVDGQTARVDGKFVPLNFAIMNVLSTLPSASVEALSERNIARDIATILANEQDMRVLLHADRQNGEWIPCSERLPDESEFVLITIDIGTVTEAGTAMVEQVLTAHYSSEEGEENLFQTIGYGNVFLSKEVTAWMPLPKPYEGGEDK